MSNLKAKYTFVSPTTNITYVLHVQTGPYTNPIHTLDNPNCAGWTIISGTLVVINDEVPTSYNVPGGAVLGFYNGLWENATDSPDGEGSPWCNGIDSLFVTFSQENNNTYIQATDSNNIEIVNGTFQDTAKLVSSVFPPQ